jgi:WXG100 family type VII secretion target
MAALVVDLAGLDRLQTAIERSIEDCAQSLATLEGQVRQLQMSWSGAATDGFQRTIADWLAGGRDLQSRLNGLRTLVATSHSNHAAAVATNVAIWRT